MNPKSANQKKCLTIEAHDIVRCRAGRANKTYLAMAQAVSFLMAKKVTRIILARPAVGGRSSFLPGGRDR